MNISSGLDPNKIQDCDMLWFEPLFLHWDLINFLILFVDKSDLSLWELKEMPISQFCALVQTSDSLEILNNCSTFMILQKVLSLMWHFLNNTRNFYNQKVDVCKVMNFHKHYCHKKSSMNFLCHRNSVLNSRNTSSKFKQSVKLKPIFGQ